MGKTLLAFDLYGTLLSTESIAKELASHFGEDKAKSIAASWRTYQLEYTWRLNSMKRYDDFSKVTRRSLQHALSENGVSLDDESKDSLMQAYDSLSTFPDVDSALQKLNDANDIECVVFSNGTKSMVTNSVQKSPDLGPHSSVFKHIVTIDFVRVYKPAPESYKYLASATGMTDDMGSMWLISGNPFDIVGARAVGMQAAWVDRAGNGWQDQLGGEPTAVVRKLEDVVDAVQKFSVKESA